jgi:hypothetical protein
MATDEQLDFVKHVAVHTRVGGAAAPYIDELLDAFEHLQLTTLEDLESYEGGALFAASGSNPAKVLKLGDDLVAASAASGGALVDNTALRNGIFRLVKAGREGHVEMEAAKGKAAKVAAGEACDVESVYADAERTQGLRVKNSERALFVVDARKFFKKHGFIAELPSIGRMRTRGTAGGVKRKIALPGADGTEEATLNLDEVRPRAVVTLADAKHALRVMVKGLIAVFADPIAADAYGGGDSGWESVPGVAEQVRLYLTRDVAFSLLWEMEASPLDQASAFIRMADHLLQVFCDSGAKVVNTGDEIIEQLMANRSKLFRTDPGGTDHEEREAAAAEPEPVMARAAGPDHGECMSWLQNGGCRDGSCPFPHMPRLAQALRGQSSRSPSGQNWHNGGGQGNQNNQNWNNGGNGGGRGNGKGNGHRGSRGGSKPSNGGGQRSGRGNNNGGGYRNNNNSNNNYNNNNNHNGNGQGGRKNGPPKGWVYHD